MGFLGFRALEEAMGIDAARIVDVCRPVSGSGCSVDCWCRKLLSISSGRFRAEAISPHQ
jgi:hypothetical protein